jgi:Protein of unknown function (DUF541)
VAGSVSLQEWTEWDESGRREVRNGYVASSRVDVRLIDIARLGQILAEAAARTEASVDGPRWEIRSENPAHEEARRRAMEDARRRADTYVQAAGLSLGGVLDIVEVGAQPIGRAIHGTFTAMAKGYSPIAEMPVHSEGLEIVAGVRSRTRSTRASRDGSGKGRGITNPSPTPRLLFVDLSSPDAIGVVRNLPSRRRTASRRSRLRPKNLRSLPA